MFYPTSDKHTFIMMKQKALCAKLCFLCDQKLANIREQSLLTSRGLGMSNKIKSSRTRMIMHVS